MNPECTQNAIQLLGRKKCAVVLAMERTKRLCNKFEVHKSNDIWSGGANKIGNFVCEAHK